MYVLFPWLGSLIRNESTWTDKDVRNMASVSLPISLILSGAFHAAAMVASMMIMNAIASKVDIEDKKNLIIMFAF